MITTEPGVATVAFTVDDRPVVAHAGQSVLAAALAAGIDIPHLCNLDGLEPYGACRLCIVEIDGLRGLPASCAVSATAGMVVRSDTERVNRVRKMVVEMMIADHPAECLFCSVNQRCALLALANRLGVAQRRLRRMNRPPLVDESNPFYTRDLRKCVLCGRCVRACGEIRGVGAIDIAGRGYRSRVVPFAEQGVAASPCESCGECVDRCPVGALQAKRETETPTREVKTTCVYCGTGCGLVLGVRGRRIVSVRGDFEHPVSRGSLCVKGRFGLDFIGHQDRLTHPLIRRDGKLERATWDEALELTARRFRDLRAQHGADALAGLASAKCTNEENYIFQRLIRTAFGTHNVDHCARLCHASTVAGLALAFGSGAMTNTVDELEQTDCIFLTGSNTTEAHPIVALRIKAAVMNRGAKLIVADPRRIDLVRFATLHLRQRSGTDVALFNAMLHVILAENLHDAAFIAARTEEFEALRRSVEPLTPERAAAITGVPAEDIRTAARLYARTPRAAIVYSMGITQHTTGTDNVLSLANLALLTGHVGKPFCGVDPLRGQNNVQGSCDMGALPDLYPGYQKVADPELRKKFEQAWGVSLPEKPGLTVVEMMHAAEAGRLKGMLIMGENPMLSDPNQNHVREALETLDFLCVQDIFLTETAQLADVVLPAVSFAEKDGTFTNTERRVQRVRAAIPPPGEARQDWAILADLATRMGVPLRYESPEQIMAEIATVTPIYGGITYARIETRGLQWPCRDAQHPGTPYLHAERFSRPSGKGKFHPIVFREAAELPDAKYPYLLTTGRYLYHWHTGTMTRRVPGLERISPPAPFEINPADAARDGIVQGEIVELSSRRGAIRARAVVSDNVPPGTIFMVFHFHEGAANVLTNDALDPIAKIPEFKVCAVRARKLDG